MGSNASKPGNSTRRPQKSQRLLVATLDDKCTYMGKRKQNGIDPQSVIADYFKYVRQYRAASAALAKAENTLWPNQQIRGLLIELTLKTYLCATGYVAWGHNLERLARDAVKRGLVLTENDQKNIISSTHEIYFKGKAWDADYICRYPMPNRGLLVTVTPTHDMLDEMIQRIVEQATRKRDEL